MSETLELPRPGFWTRARTVAADIKLSHSIFALPFAILATFLAAAHADRLPAITEIVLIVAAMVAARTVAMTVNRWADAYIDADNPRTKNRAIPSGRISRPQMLAIAIASAIAFFLIAAAFFPLRDNPWPLIVSPIVLAWLCFYSFAKRFTALCHLILGVALGLSPLAAALAIEPAYLGSPVPWLLALMVTLWVAGFDIIYALQDVATDRAVGLFSLPSRLGESPALWLSRIMHGAVVAILIIIAYQSQPLATFYAVAVAAVAGLLLLEHALIYRSRENHLDMAFFTVNGIISVLLGLAGSIDVLIALN